MYLFEKKFPLPQKIDRNCVQWKIQLRSVHHSIKMKVSTLFDGSWAKGSARLPMKGQIGVAPCIGIGLRRRLAKHFVVADVPEHYTSKTCSKCFGSCGPFEELEAKRREQMLERATTSSVSIILLFCRY